MYSSPLKNRWASSEATDFSSFFLAKSDLSSDHFAQELNITIASLVSALKQENRPGASAKPEQLAKLANELCTFNTTSRDHNALLKTHITELVRHSVLPNHAHCAAHLHCPVTITAVAAELILSSLNQSMDSWDQAPLASHMEEEFVRWFSQKIGFQPKHADGVFTSGGTQSNLTALMLARDSVMLKTGRNVKEHGLSENWQRFRIFCSAEAHFSIARSCALLGLGHSAVIAVDCDQRGRICIEALTAALAQSRARGEKTLAIVATAGTTDLGAIDPLAEMAELAQEERCWFHVDAAYGGALLLSTHKDKLKGIDIADSVSIDYHKMFFQPISCAALFVRDKRLFQGLHFNADYLNRHEDSEPNLVEKSLSTTRRFDVLKIWLSLARFGLDNFSAMIDGLLHLSQYCAQKVAETDALELFRTPELSTILFRIKNEDDVFQQTLRRSLLYSGDAVIGETRKAQQVYLKLTLLNPCATNADMDTLFNCVLDHAKKLK